MTLSVAIATYSGDDPEVIHRCLKSVYDWVDEVVIVYGSPKDKTIDRIIKVDSKKVIKFIFTDNPPMFHINKQKAIEKCTGDWILQLDTDEVVSDELKNEIQTTLHQNPKTNGFWIPRLNYFLGRPLSKGGQYPDPTIRLYRQGKGKLECQSIHEQAKIDGIVGHLKHDLLHYPWPTIEEYIQKALVRYSILEASELHNKGVHPSLSLTIKYIKVMPLYWFFKTYFRHRGYVDGYSGFIFSLFSSLRYWIIYAKLIELWQAQNKTQASSNFKDSSFKNY